jgi:DNA adenine methylase
MPSYTSRSKGVRYCGAKGRQAEYIVPIINSLTRGRGVYWEPFVGSGKIIQSVKADWRIGSDIDRPIIALLRAVQEGWNPPLKVTEEEYAAWMARRDNPKYDYNPMMGFVGYGCSFGARYFQGYARSKKGEVNFAESARLALLRQKPFLKDVTLLCRPYTAPGKNPAEIDVIYCDPPYNGTKPVGSKVSKPFDSAEFWKTAMRYVECGATVLVSEYTCPIKSAEVLWESKVAAGIRYGTGGDGGGKGSGKRKPEKLFCLNPGTGKNVGLGLF